MRNLLLFIIIAISLQAAAAPFNGQIKQFKQPDGSIVDLKLFGTEFYMRAEGLDGYTLVRDKQTNWICYATLSADNTELLSTGIIYKGRVNVPSSVKNNLNIPKHQDINEQARKKTIYENKNKLGLLSIQESNSKILPNAVIGNIKGLCIVVDFSDEIGTLPMSEFIDFCNNMNYSNYGNNGSLRTYYSDISGGLVDYQNVVYGYYRAPLTFAEYEAMPYAQGAQEILGLALNWIETTGFDFSTLSINQDGTIQAINLMYTGYAQNWAQGMWYHQGYYPNFNADGVSSGSYNCSPANGPLTIATVIHENGHMIGKWPDTYKYTSDTGPDGIGSFDLMCWYGDEYNPVPPNPHFWSNAGWGRVVDVTYYNGINSDTANSFTCYKYVNVNDTNEFFLLENRSQAGRSASIEDNGLAIWHIDRMGDNQTTHHEVYLVHANNDNTNHLDACFHSGFNNEYGLATTPNSALYNNNPSGLRVWDIGPVNNIMTYKLGAGQAAPSLVLSYINITGDANSNGFLEAGESGNINLTAGNYGQINSANATVTCSAIGANAGYVTINTPTNNIGIINISQTIPFNHNITIAPNTPIGTAIDLKFLINDGTYSTFISKTVVIGVQFNMSNQAVSTCSAIFYDAGGNESNYSDNTNFTKTITSTSNYPVRAEFTSFDLEFETNCGYDYLKIYNGPNTSAALIGTYCGTNSPGIITSSHPTGALTFKFHADESVNGTGWQAIISCVGVSENPEIDNNNEISVFPNPSNGIYTIAISENKNTEIKLTNIVGQEVNFSYELSERNFMLNISDKPAGIYFLQATTNNIVTVIKLIKE